MKKAAQSIDVGSSKVAVLLIMGFSFKVGRFVSYPEALEFSLTDSFHASKMWNYPEYKNIDREVGIKCEDLLGKGEKLVGGLGYFSP